MASTYLIHVDTAVCKGCALCIYYCPRDVFAMSDQQNQKGYIVVAAPRPERCTGCRLCEIACPDLAIYIEKEAADGH